MSTDAPDPRVTTMPRPRAPQVQHPERLPRPTPLTNDAIEQQRQRSIVQQQLQLERQQREIDRLTLSLAIRDNDYAEARREIDALRAWVARLTRKPIPWHSVALAWLMCRLEALDRWTKAWWL